jgi:hypothetical protein
VDMGAIDILVLVTQGQLLIGMRGAALCGSRLLRTDSPALRSD